MIYQVSIVGDFTEDEIESCILDYLGTVRTTRSDGVLEFDPVMFRTSPSDLQFQQVRTKYLIAMSCSMTYWNYVLGLSLYETIVTCIRKHAPFYALIFIVSAYRTFKKNALKTMYIEPGTLYTTIYYHQSLIRSVYDHLESPTLALNKPCQKILWNIESNLSSVCLHLCVCEYMMDLLIETYIMYSL